MSLIPVEIRRHQEHGLDVRWSNGTESKLSTKVLRTNCPCATCREARGEGSHEKPLSGAPVGSGGTKKPSLSLRIIDSSIEEELNLAEVWPVGNYAIGLRWGDGHATGIYTYDLLYELSHMQASS